MQRSAPVVLKARGRHTATLIFLHGLGDTGHGWAAAFNSIRPGYLKVVCPNAPAAAVTLNGGMKMPSWYDIFHLDADASGPREDMEGVVESSRYLEGLVEEETGQDTPRRSIIIGGFSQGGAVALWTALRDKKRPGLAGCVALSTYLPGNKPPDVQGKIETPILQCHGESDDVVAFSRGKLASDVLQTLAKDARFHSFPFLGHECNMDELEVIRSFVIERLGP